MRRLLLGKEAGLWRTGIPFGNAQGRFSGVGASHALSSCYGDSMGTIPANRDAWQRCPEFHSISKRGAFDLRSRVYADVLVENFRQRNYYSDVDACPIVFLYRHSIELYLKAMILWGAGLVRLQCGEDINTDRLFETHKFGELLPAIKRIFKEAEWLENTARGVRFGTFAEIEKLILAFEQIDPRSYAFRYPIDRKGDASLPEHFHFNVIALGEEAHEMLRILDGAVSGVYEMFRRLPASITTLLEKYGDYAMASAFSHAVHSLIFAFLLSGIATLLLFQRASIVIKRMSLLAYLFLATASHGVLDAMTNGGLGVAFFSPLNNNRYSLPWRPIRVSPISITRFFSAHGYAVLQSELLWIWVPAILFAALVLILRRSEGARNLNH